MNSQTNFGKKQAEDIIDKNYYIMQDKAIAAIGALQLEKNKGLEEVDMYVENMLVGEGLAEIIKT
ncbi:MAG: hypothetical protein K8S16_06085 [Bacteroidales bacterium]|nr:hypothetical protein [Bacteroidales bacterium]